MLSLINSVTLFRVLVALLCLIIWVFSYLHARCAYRLPRGGKRTTFMLALVFGAVGIFALQVRLMGRPAPGNVWQRVFPFRAYRGWRRTRFGFYTLLRKGRKQGNGARQTRTSM